MGGFYLFVELHWEGSAHAALYLPWNISYSFPTMDHKALFAYIGPFVLIAYLGLLGSRFLPWTNTKSMLPLTTRNLPLSTKKAMAKSKSPLQELKESPPTVL